VSERAIAVPKSPTAPLVLRLVRREERERWRALMRTHHYLSLQHIVGESLWYVATSDEEWVALIGWGAAALKCGARDEWIGWDRDLQWRRLHLVANNARFLILPGWNRPNIASRLLAMNMKRLSQDWELCHGHPILLAETFVDGGRFRGTCYRAAGWQVLGQTRGFGKRNQRYWHHGQPKLVLVRPLTGDARIRLVAPFMPPLRTKETSMIDVNSLPLEGAGGLIDELKTVVDPRKPRGVRHPVVTVVAIAVCAALSGARSFTAIAEWAQGLSREALKRLGSKRWKPPSEPTIRRVLQGLNANEVDGQIGRWILRQHPVTAGQGIAIDGKTLRGAHDAGQRAPHLLSAILHEEAVVIGQMEVEEKTNEIPNLPELLAPLPVEGAVITADAMHTQTETARFIVEEKKADYLFIVKNNQPTLRQDISALKLESFPPSTQHNR
jgi:hypothetical protein